MDAIEAIQILPTLKDALDQLEIIQKVSCYSKTANKKGFSSKALNAYASACDQVFTFFHLTPENLKNLSGSMSRKSESEVGVRNFYTESKSKFFEGPESKSGDGFFEGPKSNTESDIFHPTPTLQSKPTSLDEKCLLSLMAKASKFLATPLKENRINNLEVASKQAKVCKIKKSIIKA
ncbi:hypothetical protein HELRODRAFT_173835 [Helobdella robusta]|uniref:Uncharacterized protein n=1 Tax=Helobdella robusta TaxID=6412 RepID=T1F7A6_HELRO|nr:hypothetical protein HELRODRAFT_173835 [Helobdella robusta]ESO02996.1 hypothetical protein HELRODRAFT_173835 [Helobdella robusta]